jgi:hypothetical protein
MSAIANARRRTALDLGAELAHYRSILPISAKSGMRIRTRPNRVSLTLDRGAGLRIRIDGNTAAFTGARLPKAAFAVGDFQTTTESSPENTRVVFSSKEEPKRETTRDLFAARVRSFFETQVLPQLHEAALKDALNAPDEIGTVLQALQQPEVVAAVRDQDPLAEATLRGIEFKRRLLTEEGGILSAAKVGEILIMSRQAVEKRRKAGRLIGVSLGRRGYGYPAWQFSSRGVVPGLEEVLAALGPRHPWGKIAFLMSNNIVLDGKRPVHVLRSGGARRVLRAARMYGEQGAV